MSDPTNTKGLADLLGCRPPQPLVSEGALRELLNTLHHLREQVTSLQKNNSELLERARAAEARREAIPPYDPLGASGPALVLFQKRDGGPVEYGNLLEAQARIGELCGQLVSLRLDRDMATSPPLAMLAELTSALDAWAESVPEAKEYMEHHAGFGPTGALGRARLKAKEMLKDINQPKGKEGS